MRAVAVSAAQWTSRQPDKNRRQAYASTFALQREKDFADTQRAAGSWSHELQRLLDSGQTLLGFVRSITTRKLRDELLQCASGSGFLLK